MFFFKDMLRMDVKEHSMGNYIGAVKRKTSDVKMLTRQKKMLSIAALFGCLVLIGSIYTTLKPYLGHLTFYFNVESIMKQINLKETISRSSDHVEPIIYNYSNYRTDVYEIKGDLRIKGTSSTIYIASTHHQNSTSLINIKPYPRKGIKGAMTRVKNFKIVTKEADKAPHCSRSHNNIPAVVFSTGGLSNHHFHTFADLLVPLFLTSHQFNRNTLFLVTGYNSTWNSKYGVIMKKLSKYELHDLDNEDEVLCFSRIIIGLKATNDLEIVPSESRRNFTKLLDLDISPLHGRHKPRLFIISRKHNRRLVNEDELGDMARSLGFEVVSKELSTNVSLNARLVNSFDVMVGVHGAGLSNLVFMRENTVLIQIVPIGLVHSAKICFEAAAVSNKLKYLRYIVSKNESSLVDKYPLDSKYFTDPHSFITNFEEFRTVYLSNQDVNLDLNRFRKTLLRALELVGI